MHYCNLFHLHSLQLELAREDECLSCPPGKYCAGSGISSFPSSQSGNCDPGFFCRLGVNTPRPSQNFTGIGGVCPPGAYCLEGTSDPIGCPNGTFSNVSQLEDATQCTPCSDGHYCEQSNLTAPTGKKSRTNFFHIWQSHKTSDKRVEKLHLHLIMVATCPHRQFP